ncbi:MAG: tetratricopeptide repeat protein [Opitutaceae bacterium]|nr:tetratricopeptide repeat protein [Opitutaceae bacterium]
MHESSAPSGHRPTLLLWVGPVLLVVATLLAYSNTLHAPFVYDDVLAIPDNSTIRKLWPLSDVVLPHADGGLTVSGRPLLNLSFALNYAISGTAVWSYHVVNGLVHAANALLLFGIVRRTWRDFSARSAGIGQSAGRDPFDPSAAGGPLAGAAADSEYIPRRLQADALLQASRSRDGIALVIAAWWALHPLQTQAVTYTVQRAESLMGFFYLLTLYTFIRGVESDGAIAPRGRSIGPVARADFNVLRDKRETGSRPAAWLAASVGACVLGMATKEVMATAPLLVLLYDRTFCAGQFRAALRRRWRYYAGLAATWLVLAFLVFSTGGNRGGTVGLGVGLPWWAYGLTQFKALAHYLAQAAWPSSLIFEYGTFWVQRSGDIVPYAALILPLLGLTAAGLGPRGQAASPGWRTTGFLGAAIFLILAPTSLTPGTIQMIVEHRMYLPLAAVLAGAVLLVERLLPRRQRTAMALAIMMVVAFAILTVRRNHDYGSHFALWSDTVAKRPDNPRAHEGLAEAWAEVGRHDLALRHRAESIRLRPDESTYHYNLGLTQMQAGQLEEAVRSFQLSLRLMPNEARTHNNLAIVLGQLRRTDEALAHYGEAVRLKPAEPQYQYNYGVALFRTGRVDEAIARYEATLKVQPEHADAHFNLGSAYLRAQRPDDAFRHYREALRLRPDDAEFRTTFAGGLLLAGRTQEAETEYRRVLAANPKSVEAHYGIGNALAAARRAAESIEHYEMALRLEPNHANAHHKLGNALLDLDRVAEAGTHFKEAIRLAPNDAESHHNLGVAYARQEHWDEARREFDRALALKPDYAEARRNLERLRALRDP